MFPLNDESFPTNNLLFKYVSTNPIIFVVTINDEFILTPMTLLLDNFIFPLILTSPAIATFLLNELSSETNNRLFKERS